MGPKEGTIFWDTRHNKSRYQFTYDPSNKVTLSYYEACQIKTSDQRFAAMSTPISAGSPEKNEWNYQVKSNLEDNRYPPAEKPDWLSQLNPIFYHPVL